jgi:pyridinium-3,5-bisthiocarboxylic acid mononucleotide nickel chelatase
VKRILYLEPVGGIAGDMFLASALDLGVSLAELEKPLRTLDLTGWRLEVKKAERHSLTGTHLDVVVEPSGAHSHRAFTDIRALIEASGLSASAKQRAVAVFRTLGEAEAKIHGTTLEEIHFHEVGAVDSIIDICGAAIVLELLGDPTVFAAPPPLGSGTVRAAHGNLPIPAPATLEILRDLPVKFEGVGELTTPTGAALLKTFCQLGPPPPMTLERVGYGVGTKDFPDRPNVLRAVLGAPALQAPAQSSFVVEANLDDCSPQLLGMLVESALEIGALDAYVVPATMKKSRPGHLLGVLVAADKREQVVQLLLSESTTIGVRFHEVDRVVLQRQMREVQTPYGKVHVKIASRDGRVMNVGPEYEDCRALAREAGVPVKEVWAAAVVASREKPGKG